VTRVVDVSRCGRYAPSPTGRLHQGNLRTALLAWLHTRLNRGRFILRMDDLDQPRNRKGAADQIIADLRWLGIDWDEGPDVGGPSYPYNQSARSPSYRQAYEQLLEQGLLFPCYCSRKDIAAAISAPHATDNNKIYPGTCRPDQPTTRFDTGGRETAWRYRVDHEEIEFCDHVFGVSQQNLGLDVGDFVIKRRDGLFAYQLATVVDDALMGVTDVVRGSDLIDSSARQIALFGSLDYSVPEFWHVPLMNDDQGKRLCKRDGSDSLEQLQDQGIKPSQVVSSLANSCGLVNTRLELSAQELLIFYPGQLPN